MEKVALPLMFILITLIFTLTVWLIWRAINSAGDRSEADGNRSWHVFYFVTLPLIVIAGLILIFVTFYVLLGFYVFSGRIG
jgi:ABC-type uncharacterized transport system YnjBCD permease subunit